MLQFKKNDLLIGFTVSILLTLFVNFSMLTRAYNDMALDSMIPEIYPRVYQDLYFSLVWFFFFAFILYILNDQIYKLEDKFFHKKEYKALLYVIAISIGVAYGLFLLYPVLYETIFCDWLGLNIPQQGNFAVFSQSVRATNHEDIFIPAPPPMPQAMPLPVPFPFLHTRITEHLFVLLTVMLSALLFRLLNSRQQMALEYEQLKTEKLQSSYNALMGQINPHFFFNSLNGLNSLIRSGEKEQTLTYLDELSNVFRYILQSNKKELVTLAEELQFVKAYTYLLSVRYEGKLFFSIQADPPHLLWYLPILSVLPLIENAVKHNVISKQYPLQIDVYTTGDNELVVSNKIQPKIEGSSGSGIGLKNLWGRYRMLTGKDIHISNRKEYFKVSLPLLPKPIHS